MQTNLSVIIITKNEASNIIECLNSVFFADEIIVFDSGSTDNTVALCRNFSDKVTVFETSDWLGYGIQKERARQQATKDWVLSIDADERVSERLQKEILSTLPKTQLDGFEIRFHSEYCGKRIRFGDWINDKQMVLFRREKGRFVNDSIHERIELSGRVGKLKGIIHHLAFPNLESVLRKVNAYSTASAIQKNKQHIEGGVLKALGRGIWTFFRGYILRLGFLDGKRGFMLAVSNAEGSYYRYIKLMFLNQENP